MFVKIGIVNYTKKVIYFIDKIGNNDMHKKKLYNVEGIK